MNSKSIVKIALISTCFWQGFCFDAQGRTNFPIRKHKSEKSGNDKTSEKAFVEQYCKAKGKIIRGKKRYPVKCVLEAEKAYEKTSSNKKKKIN
jgi:hypothetical protein